VGVASAHSAATSRTTTRTTTTSQPANQLTGATNSHDRRPKLNASRVAYDKIYGTIILEVAGMM
jgi:hypothetical protein